MANADWPHGLWPLYTQHGGPWGVKELTKDSAQATAIFRGDLVAREADGKLAPGGTPGATLYDGVSLDFGAASTETQQLIVVDPLAIFEAQDNGDGIDEVDEGLNVNFEFNAGSASTQVSGHELDGSTKNTTAILDAHIIGRLKIQNNDFGANCRFEVQINKHRRAFGVAGV